MIRTLLPLTLMLLLSQTASAAKEFPAQLRLFAGALAADPKDVNEELEANSLKKFDAITMFGGEISRSLAKHFEIGLRYAVRIGNQDELVSNELTSYEASLNQEVYSLVARVPIVKSSILRFDAWGAYGGSNTRLKLKTATDLANLYNLAISQPDPKMSDKILSSLAHDILVMDMWAHRSFDDVFHETLFDAVVFAHSDPEECEKELLKIADDGIDYKRAEKLIHDLTVFHEDEYERTFKSTP